MTGRHSPVVGMLLWGAVWLSNIVLAAVSVSLLRSGVGGALRPLVALLPALPLPLGLVLYVWRVARMDELRQRLTVGSFALASAVVGVVVYGWSLAAGQGVPPVPAVWVLPAQMLLWGALMLLLRLRFP